MTPYTLGEKNNAYNLSGCDEHKIQLAIAHNLGLLVHELRETRKEKVDFQREVQAKVEPVFNAAVKSMGVA